ncbi:hypothetical protein DFH06DRAFT_659244 [Mycena polygramma]|nr:hypothetical protein DFH06DRAFT_659244 [Mycena polygramma]
MSHPVLWPRLFFYPVGNTSAVCLTDNIPPEKPANVLLLGCGDPRNILYTLHVDPPIHRPAVDFLCCDIEPAVITRNILLFTLIYDGHPSDRIWDIFYHIKVDKTSFALLIAQCKKLLDASKDLGSWRQSCYSRFLKFSSTYTLSRVHHYLGLYAQTEADSCAKHEEVFRSFTRESESRRHGPNDVIFDTAQSAGIFSAYVLRILTRHFYHYWETGTVSRSSADIGAATLVNPTFVYSDSFTPSLVGDHCSLHYGTYPLEGFHLAAAFLDSSTDGTVTEDQLVACARAQLEEWCSRFQTTVSQKAVTITLFIGDAIPFCEKLACESDVHPHVAPWKAAELVFDGDYSCAQTEFDTIDTSNLVEHMGVLNVLIAAVPLLAHRNTSVLYTELLLEKDEGSKPWNLVQPLCADISTLGLLLGLSPDGYIAQFTSATRVQNIAGSTRYRERLAWKCPYAMNSDGDFITPSFSDPVALGNTMFSIYEQMFADENVGQLLSRSRPEVYHYNRGTFAALLKLVKSRVQSDWTAVMGHIFYRLHNDRTLLMGSNGYQELCCQLYLRGVHCVEALGPRRTPIDLKNGVFKGWKEVPPVVRVVLVVPRQKIRLLEGEIGRQLGSPMFQCHLRGSGFHNIFSCIHAVLGTVSIHGSGSDARIDITEDAGGWSGTAPLIVSACLPAFNLVFDDPKSTRVSLGLHPTPSTSLLLATRLGPELVLFTANILDKSAVHVTTNGVGFTPALKHNPSPSGTHVSVRMDGSRASTLSARWEPGLSLKEAKVEYEQVSPCAMQVAVSNNVKKILAYPFPIDGSRTKVRIARTSGWIEFESPIRPALELADLAIPSVVVQDRSGPVVRNIHRVSLESLPLLQGKALDRQAAMISSHCFFAFSDREHALISGTTAKNVLIQVKDTIMHLFVTLSRGHHVLSLSNGPEQGGTYTLIFANGIRMDLASHTYAIDACVLPFTENLMKGPLGSRLRAIRSQRIVILTPGAEVAAWKHLLVAFTERCRSWMHKPTCKYTVSGKIPVSTEMFQNPLCGCGEGVDPGILPDPQFEPFAPLMTRAAISPLFAIPYLETVHQRLEAMNKQPGKRVCAGCNKPEEKLLKCSRCGEVDYCGRACQTAHWKAHKPVCKAK